jgi:hypothetical protein
MNNYLVAALTLVTTVVLSASVLSGADRSLKAAQISSDGASAAAPILAGEKPRVPCDAEPYPNYPPLDAEPVVALWSSDELGDHWSPPACTEWPANSANKVVGLAGHFRDSRDANAMLARIGAISSLRDIRYWSVGQIERALGPSFRVVAAQGIGVDGALPEFLERPPGFLGTAHCRAQEAR